MPFRYNYFTPLCPTVFVSCLRLDRGAHLSPVLCVWCQQLLFSRAYARLFWVGGGIYGLMGTACCVCQYEPCAFLVFQSQTESRVALAKVCTALAYVQPTETTFGWMTRSSSLQIALEFRSRSQIRMWVIAAAETVEVMLERRSVVVAIKSQKKRYLAILGGFMDPVVQVMECENYSQLGL